MKPENILSYPARVLSPAQRASYFDDGYLLVERAIGEDWLVRLREGVAGFVAQSRSITSSDAVFDLESGHSADTPRLRRVSSPCDQDDVFWSFLKESPLIEILADVLGPNVKFYQSKLNFKWAKGGAEVKWHQDVPFFPHTNAAVLTVGLYLEDSGPEQGPLMVVPGSHKREIFNHYDDNGTWTGDIQPGDLNRVDTDSAVELCGPAGSITIHNYRAVHGSRPNLSGRGRPLLLNVVSAADAMPYTPNALKSRYEQAILAGDQVQWAHHESGEYLIPPDWSGGYTSIFALQQREKMA
jgi:ectoine hydroxylase-related dioxygenase (phytanoyl-CoA dioxygenase family)